MTDALAADAVWLLADAAVRGTEVSAVCAPDPPAAIVVFYSDDADLRAERLSEAVRLARACPSAPVFLVGGARPHRNYFGAEGMADGLAGMGVVRSRLNTGRQSYDTRTNVAEAEAMAKAREIRRLALVSDALHLLRVRAAFRGSGTVLELLEFPARGRWSLPRAVSRVNYEAAAWLGMYAPQALRRWVFVRIGRQ